MHQNQGIYLTFCYQADGCYGFAESCCSIQDTLIMLHQYAYGFGLFFVQLPFEMHREHLPFFPLVLNGISYLIGIQQFQHRILTAPR